MRPAAPLVEAVAAAERQGPLHFRPPCVRCIVSYISHDGCLSVHDQREIKLVGSLGESPRCARQGFTRYAEGRWFAEPTAD